jgi:hypothetical protein
MKTLTQYMTLGAVVWCLAGISLPMAASASDWGVGVEVRAVEDFYEPLSDHGYWVHRDAYGWCWYPAYVAEDWRPYTTGHWEWTDDGWYWASEEPWAWACYHYGRWVYDENYGWLWVPGVEWAPSWVSWREGGGYIGWAPMPPDCYFDSRGYFSYSYESIHPYGYVFVEYGSFCRPIYPAIIFQFTYVHHDVYHKTHDCTKMRREHNRVKNDGPSVKEIEHKTSTRINQRPVDEVVKEDVERRARIDRATVPSNRVDRNTGRVVNREMPGRTRNSGAAGKSEYRNPNFETNRNDKPANVGGNTAVEPTVDPTIRRGNPASQPTRKEIRTLNPAARLPTEKSTTYGVPPPPYPTREKGVNRDQGWRPEVWTANPSARPPYDSKAVGPDPRGNAEPKYQNVPRGNVDGRNPSAPSQRGVDGGKSSAPNSYSGGGKGSGNKAGDAGVYDFSGKGGSGWKSQ